MEYLAVLFDLFPKNQSSQIDKWSVNRDSGDSQFQIGINHYFTQKNFLSYIAFLNNCIHY